MINIKQGNLGQRLTYSQRRRLINLLNLLWSFVSNAAFPLIIGFVLGMSATLYAVAEAFDSMDKTGLSYCIKPDFQANADITGVVGETSTTPPGTCLPDFEFTETTDSIAHTCTEINGIQLLKITSI